MKMNYTLILTTAILLFSSVTTFSAPDKNFHIYLCFGQSNMEGAAPIESQDRNVDPRFMMMSSTTCGQRKMGEWYTATPPLARCNTNLGVTDYFGRGMIEALDKEIKVGVIVVAVGGCDIQLFEKNNYQSYAASAPDWMKGAINDYGGNPYKRLIDLAKIAQESGVIKGILLHQGETNTGQANWPQRVKGIYDNIISDLGLKAEETPLLVGETLQQSGGGACWSHNNVIAKIPSTIPNSYVISSEGFKGIDQYHFTSADYRKFGKRYAEQMLKLIDATPAEPAVIEPDFVFNGNTLTIETEDMKEVKGQYCQKWNNLFNGMAYYANDDETSSTIKFEKAGTFNFTLNGCSDDITEASVTLHVGNESKTYTWNNNTPSEITNSISVPDSGLYTIRILMETDFGQSDAFVDYIKISEANNETQAINTKKDDTQISITNNTIRIYDKSISQTDVFSIIGTKVISSKENEISIENLKQGIYLISCRSNDNSVYNYKIVKK